MEEFLAAQGLPALFLLSFLAATLIPLGSEWMLLLLLDRGAEPGLTVAVATAGNTLGALTTYLIGRWGGPLLAERVLRMDAATRRQAEARYARWGSWSLLLSWVPVIGDPLCLVGGLLRVPPGRFLLLVGGGKLARYAALALLAAPALAGP